MLLYEKNHPVIQFLKYVLCGGFAFAADIITFFIVAWFWFPCLTENDVLVRLFGLSAEPVAESLRAVNFRVCTVFAFIVSNLTAYVLNVLFVFKSGRHSRWREVGLFYLVSGVSGLLGMEVGAFMISTFGLSTSFSYVAKSISAMLINYAGRKFFIFRG